MNMQNLMKQAQKMQQEMLNKKEEINKKEFSFTSSLVSVVVNGKKEILKLNIEKTNDIEKDDIEMLEDMLVVALNNVFKLVDNETDKKIGSIAPGLSDLM